MLGSQITPINPFNIGQYGIGQVPNLGMGYGQYNIPMQTPGLWTGQMGMPGIGQTLGMQGFGMPGMQGYGMPGIPGIPGIPGVGTSPGLGIGQNIPGTSPYGLFGFPNLGGGIFGGIGQNQQGFGMQGLNPFGGLFGGFNPFNIPSLPNFTVHSVAVITPSIDPLAQLVRHISQAGLLNAGVLNPYDQNPLAQLGLGQQFGQLGQWGQLGQLNPFAFGAQGLMQPGGRQVVRAYVQTMMGLIPIDLVV
jgi:hypothetical protein